SVLLYFSFFCLFVLLLPCLLLSRYADPPYLPSFPPRRSSDLLLALAAGALAAGCVRVHVHGDPDHAMTLLLRVATYNASLYDDEAGGLLRRLDAGDAGARKVAAVLQRVRPDVVLINEFDYEGDGRAADLFQRRYLEVEQA